MGQLKAPYDLDSDEIASIASEDLYNSRPNRWTGPRSTWRHHTHEERHLWRSLQRLQGQDLAIHLYNFFALRKRARDPKLSEDLMILSDDGEKALWVPPRKWTAWPLDEHQFPEPLDQTQQDTSTDYVLRKEELYAPSLELQEELTAVILRQAKHRFGKWAKKNGTQPDTHGAGDNYSDPLRAAKPTPLKDEESEKEEQEEDEEEDDDDDRDGMDLDAPLRPAASKATSSTLHPVLSADDELSSELSRAPIRHILTQLDKTLTILHNTRLAGLNYNSDSSTDEDSDSRSPRASRAGSSEKRPRGRPKGPSRSRSFTKSPTRTPPAGKPKRGRPRKVHVPREGETVEEMHQRIAREGHRALPPRKEDIDAAFEEWMRQSTEGETEGDQSRPVSRAVSIEPSHSRSRKLSRGLDPDDEGPSMESVRVKVGKWGLRDWSDVLGAAALAGFSDEVIERATKRCSDLFGERMLLRQLQENPISSDSGVRTFDYIPQKISASDLDANTDEAESEPDTNHSATSLRLPRRHFDSRRSAASSPSAFTPGRSLTRSSASVFFRCPVKSCSRSKHGFDRKANLMRHVERIHEGYAGPLELEGSDDEVVGAVHVDGFLKPILPGSGWRGHTVRERIEKTDTAEEDGESERESGEEGDEDDEEAPDSENDYND